MLQYARELMQASETRSGLYFIFAADASRIKRSLAEAVKDNDFIYHAMVPERSALSPIGKFPVAKLLPYSPPLSSGFKGQWLSCSLSPGVPGAEASGFKSTCCCSKIGLCTCLFREMLNVAAASRLVSMPG